MHLIFEATILGEPASKANSRRMVTLISKEGKRYKAPIKSEKALSYIETFRAQCHRSNSPTTDDVAVEIDVWYRTRRPDLDESVILDALQGVAYANDRQVRQKFVRGFLDKENPRADIRVYLLLEKEHASEARPPRRGNATVAGVHSPSDDRRSIKRPTRKARRRPVVGVK